jgi:hypothetical protein
MAVISYSLASNTVELLIAQFSILLAFAPLRLPQLQHYYANIRP